MDIKECYKQAYLFKQCVTNPDFVTALIKNNHEILKEYIINYAKHIELYEKLISTKNTLENDKVQAFVTLRRIELILFFTIKHLVRVNSYTMRQIDNVFSGIEPKYSFHTAMMVENIPFQEQLDDDDDDDDDDDNRTYIGEREDTPIPLYFKPYELPSGPVDKNIIEILRLFYDDVVYLLKFIIQSRKKRNKKETWWVPPSFSFNRDKEVSIGNGDTKLNVVLVDTFKSMRSIYDIKEDSDFSYIILNAKQVNIERKINQGVLTKFLYVYLYKIFPDLLRFQFNKDDLFFNMVPNLKLTVSEKFIQEKGNSIFEFTSSSYHYEGCETKEDYNHNKEIPIVTKYHKYIERCLSNGARFVLIFLKFKSGENSYHANVLIFNNKKKEFEVFDPHGNPIGEIVSLYRNHNREFTALIPKEYQPESGIIPIHIHDLPVQPRQEEEYGSDIVDGGNCRTWTVWFAEVRLQYPDKNFEEVKDLLYRHHLKPRIQFPYPGTSGKYNMMGRYLTNLIRSYTIHIYKNYNGMMREFTSEVIPKPLREDVLEKVLYRLKIEKLGINEMERKEAYLNCVQKKMPRLPYFSENPNTRLGYHKITPFIAPGGEPRSNMELQTYPTGAPILYIEGTGKERGPKALGEFKPPLPERNQRSTGPNRFTVKSTPRGGVKTPPPI